MKWQCECGECQYSEEQQERLNQFTREELLGLIPDLVCDNPRASAILKNKWLTKSHDILCRVKEEYEDKTREPLSFWDEGKISAWLRDLYYTVLSPLDNVIPVLPLQSEALILFFIADWRRLYEEIIPSGDDDSWYCHLMDFWLKAVYENAHSDVNFIIHKIDDMNKIIHARATSTSMICSIYKLPDGDIKNVLIKKYNF